MGEMTLMLTSLVDGRSKKARQFAGRFPLNKKSPSDRVLGTIDVSASIHLPSPEDIALIQFGECQDMIITADSTPVISASKTFISPSLSTAASASGSAAKSAAASSSKVQRNLLSTADNVTDDYRQLQTDHVLSAFDALTEELSSDWAGTALTSGPPLPPQPPQQKDVQVRLSRSHSLSQGQQTSSSTRASKIASVTASLDKLTLGLQSSEVISSMESDSDTAVAAPPLPLPMPSPRGRASPSPAAPAMSPTSQTERKHRLHSFGEGAVLRVGSGNRQDALLSPANASIARSIVPSELHDRLTGDTSSATLLSPDSPNLDVMSTPVSETSETREQLSSGEAPERHRIVLRGYDEMMMSGRRLDGDDPAHDDDADGSPSSRTAVAIHKAFKKLKKPLQRVKMDLQFDSPSPAPASGSARASASVSAIQSDDISDPVHAD